MIERVCTRVQYLKMSGNYLPTLIEKDELSKLHTSGCVSLTLPSTGSPGRQWQNDWDDIATHFGSRAYDPDVLHYGELWRYTVLLSLCVQCFLTSVCAGGIHHVHMTRSLVVAARAQCWLQAQQISAASTDLAAIHGSCSGAYHPCFISVQLRCWWVCLPDCSNRS